MSLRTCARIAAALAVVLVVGCGDDPVSPPRFEYSESEVHSFAAGAADSIAAATFAGVIKFIPDNTDSIRITVTRWANLAADLNRLQVESSRLGDTIAVSATNPEQRKQVAVDIKITGPPQPVLDLAVAAGAVDCQGRPGSSWRADVAAGSATFSVPADVNIAVELLTAAGGVSVEFDVVGEVAARRVVGVIGTGADGEIVAHVAAGNIRLNRR